MQHSNLPIFRAPQEKKVEGFELVENFFIEHLSDIQTTSLSHEDILNAKRGIFQALSLLIDFGHLDSANTFIKANPLILRMPFSIKSAIDPTNESDDYVDYSDEYKDHSPLLMIAPYLSKKGLSLAELQEVRPLFFAYNDSASVLSRYSRDEIIETLELWFKLGLEVVSYSSNDTVNYSVADLAMTMSFATAHMDKILKYTLASPMCTGTEREDLTISFLMYLASSIEVDKLSDDLRFTKDSMMFAALNLNALIKHNGNLLFDISKVQEGNYSVIEEGLSPYIISEQLNSIYFSQLVELIYILLRGIDTLGDSVVMQETTMSILMEVNDIDIMEALSLVKTDEQRDIILSLMSS